MDSSGILNNLLPDDQILADHGFNVADTVGLFYEDSFIHQGGKNITNESGYISPTVSCENSCGMSYWCF